MTQQPDIIGTLYKRDGEYDQEGNVTKAPTAIQGYHVNFASPVPELSEYLVAPQPATPYRVYAGGVVPVAYCFPDEQTFKHYYPDQEPDI